MDFRNISAWAIRNPVPPIVLFLALTLAGIVAFMGMDVNDDPDIDFPVVIVVINQPGAAPSAGKPSGNEGRSPAHLETFPSSSAGNIFFAWRFSSSARLQSGSEPSPANSAVPATRRPTVIGAQANERSRFVTVTRGITFESWTVMW